MPVIPGTGGPDILDGTAGDDIIQGMAGDDILDGLAGDDILEGGDDDDELFSGTGNDNLYGGAGNDELTADDGGGTANLYGEDGDDEFNVHRTGGGAVLLDGGMGDDEFDIEQRGTPLVTILAGAGEDTVDYRSGNVLISFGPDSDLLLFHPNYVFPTGGAGIPTITDFETGPTGDVIALLELLAYQTNWTGSHNPILDGHLRLVQSGADTLIQVDRDGGANSWTTVVRLQTFTASTLTNFNIDEIPVNGLDGTPMTVPGTAGPDSLEGGFGNDVLLGGDDDDDLYGFVGDDFLDGGDGDDFLVADFGDDILVGGAGQDQLLIGPVGGNVQAFGGDDGDLINLTRLRGGSALLDGGAGDDLIAALQQQGGPVTILGGSGDDIIILGSNATVTGGSGFDVISLDPIYELSYGPSTITDFEPGSFGDAIDLFGFLFSLPIVADPFGEGFLRFIQGTTGAVIQIDPDGDVGPAGWSSVFLLSGVNVGDLTPDNFGGLEPAATVDRAPSLVVAPAYVQEGDGGFTISVIVPEISTATLSLTYAVSPGGTATPGLDFANVSGTINVNAQQPFGDFIIRIPAGTATIGIIDDLIAEGTETIRLTLTGGPGIVFANGTSTTTIDIPLLDNEPLTASPGGGVLNGTPARDRLVGGAGNDQIFGLGDADILTGGGGNDSLSGGDGNDILDGEAGVDVLSGGNGDDTLVARDGDTLDGGPGTDIVDFRNAASGVTFTLGSSGLITTGGMSLTLASIEGVYGSNLDDILIGTPGADQLFGYAGNDIIESRGGADIVDGGDGTDTLRSNGADLDYRTATIASIERLQFSPAAAGTAQNARFNASQIGAGLSSSLILTGSSAQDSVQVFVASGGSVNTSGWTFQFPGWEFQDYIVYVGDVGNESFVGWAGLDIYFGSPGDDRFDGGGAFDFAAYLFSPNGVTADLAISGPQAIGGNQGSDTFLNLEGLAGSQFADTLRGDASANIILGLGGDDVIAGRAGNDDLRGGDGADRIEGGAGNDTLAGEAGADTFIFRTATEGADTITDFTVGVDRIEVSAAGLGGGLVAGAAVTLVANGNPVPTGAGGQFLYDTDDGNLYWDADGSGAGQSVLLLTLANRPALTAASIAVTSIAASFIEPGELPLAKLDLNPGPETSPGGAFDFSDTPPVLAALGPDDMLVI